MIRLIGLGWMLATVMLAPLQAQSRREPPDTARQFEFTFAFSFAFAFAPDQVLAHGETLGLDDRQVATVRRETRRIQEVFSAQYRRVRAAHRDLERMLAMPHADEGTVMATLDRILAIEWELKRLQVRLLLRVRNALTPAQQARLLELVGGQR
jgi:Spy/CpxP family protein refolding chaperone